MRETPQPKRKASWPIPDDLREFLTDVHQQIEAKDEAAMEPSDDLLQCEVAYGGLEKARQPWYSFVYFPARGTHPKWELRLHADDVGRIASGSLAELPLWSCGDPACGNRFSDVNETCAYCDYVEDDGERRRPPDPKRRAEVFTVSWTDPRHPNVPDVTEHPTWKDVEERLLTITRALREKALVTVNRPSRASAVVGLGGSPSVAILSDPKGTRISVGNAKAPGTIGFSKGEDWVEMPARHGIAESLALKALTLFFSGAPLPADIAWE